MQERDPDTFENVPGELRSDDRRSIRLGSLFEVETIQGTVPMPIFLELCPSSC